MKKCLYLLIALMAFTATAWAQTTPEGNWSDWTDADWGEDYESTTEFTIAYRTQLVKLANMVNSGYDFSGKTVTIVDPEPQSSPWGTVPVDFAGDLNEHYWTPIGTAEHPFNGTFNGNGKSVQYVYIDGSDSYQGFFGHIGESGTVQNFVVNICTISGTTQVGGLVGYNQGTVQNCIVCNMTMTGTSYVGAIIGQNEGSVSGCYCYYSNTQNGEPLPDPKTKSIGAANSTTGTDIVGYADRLYYATKASNITITHEGTPTGQTIGNAVIYNNGVQHGVFFFKQGATATLAYNQLGYTATFNVEGEGSSITGSTLTVGTENFKLTCSNVTVAEWSGSGNSANDPYIIVNREQLDMLATRVNDGESYQGKFFRLDNDISYDVADAVYTPIGTEEHPFKGTFDGNGNRIEYASSEPDNEELYANDYQGLFGFIGTGGTVKNLGTYRCTFIGISYVGGIAAYNAGTIENCRIDHYYSYGWGGIMFSADNSTCFGTVAGYNSGVVRECVSAAPINNQALDSYSNVTKVGGIVGHNTGTIQNCLYLGSNVNGTVYVGAIVGHNEGGTLINNFYHDNGNQTNGNVAAGTVKGVGVSNDITGSDGDNAKKANVVTFVHASGSHIDQDGINIDATPSLVTTNNPNNKPVSVYADGILFNDSYMGSQMNRAFYTTATSVGLTYTGTVPSGYVIVFNKETGENSSISGNTLIIGDDVVEVSAREQRGPSSDSWVHANNRAASFSTTGENSITIMSAAELGLLAYNVNFENETYSGYTITLGNNIDLNGHIWEPINYGLDAALYGNGGFIGTFNGAGYVISNMNTEYPQYAGLFSVVGQGVTVSNVTITDALVKSGGYTGVIAGMNLGVIENCHIVGGSVTYVAGNDGGYGGPGAMLFGGIAGMNQGGTIEGCTVMSTDITVSVAVMGIGGIAGAVMGSDSDGSGATLTNNLFGGTLTLDNPYQWYGAVAGVSMDYAEPNTVTNNYYLGNTIGGIDNTDSNGEAMRGYAHVTLPDGIGTEGSTYTPNGITVYTNGLYYDGYYYTTTMPTLTLEVAGYGNSNSGWVFIASPVIESIAPTEVGGIFSASKYDLYRFNQSNANGTEWENYKNNDHTSNFNLVNGQGYLYATKETQTLSFSGLLNTAQTQDVELAYDNGASMAGYNLVGNPFPRAAYANMSYYTLDPTGSFISANEVSAGTPISPCTGVIVQATATGQSVTFSTTPQQNAINNGNLQITLSQVVEPVETPVNRGDGPSTGSGALALDNAIVSFNEGTELGKFYFGRQSANIYIPQNGEEYAIAFSEGQGEMPLNFKAKENGTYTISVNPEGVEMGYLHLIDNMTGADVDLLVPEPVEGPASYTFAAKTTDYASRFKLVFSANGTDGPSTGSGTFAFISDGNIIVNGEGVLQIVDVTGRVVVTRGGRIQCVPTSGMTPGVYVLRLINGNDVRTQKIIIR